MTKQTINQNLKAEFIKNLIEASKGQFFTVDNIKANGEPRSYNGQLEVDPRNKSTMITIKQSDKRYRRVNLLTVKRLKVAGNEYTFS